MEIVLLRFDAPLMSFGGVLVDQHNKTDPLPYRAMLTGLVANALGFTRRDETAFAALQARIRYAARRDRKGSLLVDYQTVDFDPAGPMASDLGWTTRGVLEERKGGEASDGTHIRYRHYWADAIVTVALTLDPPDEKPGLSDLSAALRAPARPLFLGRKCCVPSVPVWLGEMEAASLREALETTPRVSRGDDGPLQAVWPAASGEENAAENAAETVLWARVEDRDPVNAIHTGRRMYVLGNVVPPSRVGQTNRIEGQS